MNRTRRQLSKHFKNDSVRQVTDGGKRVTDVAREVGITNGLLSRWARESKLRGGAAFAGTGTGTGHQSVLEEENRKLRREKARLQEDQTI